MTTRLDRRDTRLEGLFVVTARADTWKGRLAETGIRARTVVLQDPHPGQRVLPEFRSPMVLDTVHMPIDHLVRVLAELQRLKTSSQVKMTDLRVIAITDIDDVRAQRLCALCSAIVLIGANTAIAEWLPVLLRHLGALKDHAPQRVVHWMFLGVPPHTSLNSDMLVVFAALPHIRSLRELPVYCRMSQSAVSRTIRTMKAEWKIPFRYSGSPHMLYTSVLEGLATVEESVGGAETRALSLFVSTMRAH